MGWYLSCALLILATGPASEYGDVEVHASVIKVALSARAISVDLSAKLIGLLSDDGKIVLLSTADGSVVSTILPPGLPGWTIAVSPNSEWVATAGAFEVADDALRAVGNVKALGDPGVIGTGYMSAESRMRGLRYKIPQSLPIMNINQFTRPRGGAVNLHRISERSWSRRRVDFPKPIHHLAFGGNQLVCIDATLSTSVLNEELKTTQSYAGNFPIGGTDRSPGADAAFSHDAKRVVCLTTGPELGRLSLVCSSVDTKRTIRADRGPDSPAPWAVSASPDGRTFATSGAGLNVHIWDMHTGRLLRTIEPQRGGEGDALFIACPDSDTVLTCASDGCIRVMERDSGEIVFTGTGPKDDVRAVILHEGRLTVVSGGFRQVGDKVDPLVITKIKLTPAPRP